MGLSVLETTVAAGFLLAGVRMAAPLVAAALGETLSEHGGTVNLGTEGVMLVGATAGFAAAFGLQGAGWGAPAALSGGVLAALLAGAVCGSVLALVMVVLRADQVVAGLAFSILSVGACDLLFRKMAGEGSLQPTMDAMPALAYGAFGLIPAVWFVLFRTRWGVSLRACGDNPLQAEMQGVRVALARGMALLAGCGLAGVGGMVLSVGCAGTLSYNMVAGRGYIAVAIVYLGNWRPWSVLWATLLFGLADAAQMRLQAVLDIPYQLLSSVPYLVAVAALGLLASRSRRPLALMKPYWREEWAGRVQEEGL